MQRQPLKIYNGTGEPGLAPAAAVEDTSSMVAASHSASSSSSTSPDTPPPILNAGVNGSAYFSTAADDNDEEQLMSRHDKPMRNHHRSPLIAMYHSKPERCIHAIPVLIFLCIFALYLCSHEPSPKDLFDIKGFRLPSELTELTDIDYFERYTGKAEKTETEEDSFTQNRGAYHRKLLRAQTQV